MTRNPKFIYWVFALCLVYLTYATGCAVQVAPGGGPRDSLPPVPSQFRPPDSAINFVGKRIQIEFNEYIQLDNITQNLIVSPTPRVNPLVESRLKLLTITLKDTLLTNTTYSLDFGNAIKDVNEGNVLKNFRYVFSSGSYIDSLQLDGKVIHAETGKPDSTLLALLYTRLDDSAVAKEKPRYMTRLRPDGSFHFRNLPPGTYALYALKDEGGSRLYLSRKQLFAFADKPVEAAAQPQNIILYAYAEKETAAAAPATATGKAKPIGTAEKILRLETNLSSGLLDLLSNLEFYFRESPLALFDSAGIVFTNESYQPITEYRWLRDSTGHKLTLVYRWTENTGYHLVVPKEALRDSAGKELVRRDTLSFRTRHVSEYGSVRLRFTNLDLSRKPVLQFIKSGQVAKSYFFTSREYFEKIFQPGDYELRILYDENGNGVWDPGDFFGKHRQPEIVIPVERKLTIKANWDNEVDISLPETG